MANAFRVVVLIPTYSSQLGYKKYSYTHLHSKLVPVKALILLKDCLLDAGI